MSAKGLLIRVLYQSVRVQLAAGDAAAATPLARRAVDLAEDFVRRQPNDIRGRSNIGYAYRTLGRCEAKAGHAAEAVRAFERAAELDLLLTEEYPVQRFNLACDLALMCPLVDPARRETLAARAVGQIRLALAAGYSRDALRDDHDLDALRTRDDFILLLMDVAMPSDPFQGAR